MRSCDWTDRIESASLRGTFDHDERSHVHECAECRKLTRIVRLLVDQGRAAEQRGARHVPSAQAVLLRARQVRARKIERRALKPIVWVERVAIAAGLLTGLAVWSWLAQRMGAPDAALLQPGLESPAQPDLTTLAMLVSGVGLLVATLFGLAGPGKSMRHRR